MLFGSSSDCNIYIPLMQQIFVKIYIYFFGCIFYFLLPLFFYVRIACQFLKILANSTDNCYYCQALTLKAKSQIFRLHC